MNEKIASIMTRNVVTVAPTDMLSRAKELMFANDIHHLPVVEGKKLVGMISTYDLAKLGKAFSEYDQIRVSDVMTRKLAKLEPNDKVGAAAEIFLEHLFHGLPIVNERGELMGILTTHDILRYEFHKEYPKQDLPG